MAVQAAPLHVGNGANFESRLTQLRTRVVGRLKLGLYTGLTRYGLCRDLAQPLTKPNAKIPITVRPLQDGDLEALFATEAAEVGLAERLEVAWRRAFVDRGAHGGFVAVDKRTNTPCYVQWLFSSHDNDFIQSLGSLPALQANEALLENAYTPPAYRGLGIMSEAMALIAERATAFGAHYVLTFVDDHNIASLKGCQRAGFYPAMFHRRTRWAFGLITRDRFEKFPDEDSRRLTRF